MKFTHTPLLILLLFSCKPNPGGSTIEKADQIHHQILTVDTHTDSPLNLMNPEFDIGKNTPAKIGGQGLIFAV